LGGLCKVRYNKDVKISTITSLRAFTIKVLFWLIIPLSVFIFIHDSQYTFVVYKALFNQVNLLVGVSVVLVTFELVIVSVCLLVGAISFIFNKEYCFKNLGTALLILFVSYIINIFGFPLWVLFNTMIFYNFFHFLHLS
jgi:hypothetical protein